MKHCIKSFILRQIPESVAKDCRINNDKARMKERTLFDTASPPDLPSLVKRFLESLKNEKNASDYTLVNYEIDLRHWHEYLFTKTKGPFQFSKLSDLKLLREYLAKEMETYSRSTICRRLSVIKGFLKFLHREGYLEKNVAKLISLPRAEEPLPFVLKEEDVIKLIEGIPTDNLRHKRTRAVVELLYSTGIRVSELTALKEENVDFKNSTIVVFGKGKKERMVPIGRHCATAIRNYIDSMPQIQKHGPKTPLFLNADGGGVSVRTIQRNLREFAIEVLGPAGANVTPHTLRHSCASHLLSRGAGLRQIQELLGHESLVTTQKYTHLDIDRLKATYNKTHPRDKMKIEGEA